MAAEVTISAGRLAGGDDPPRDLVANTHEAWVRFAADGNPNHAGLPDWPRWNAETRPTMLLDAECRLANRPADDEVSLWDGVLQRQPELGETVARPLYDVTHCALLDSMHDAIGGTN